MSPATYGWTLCRRCGGLFDYGAIFGRGKFPKVCEPCRKRPSPPRPLNESQKRWINSAFDRPSWTKEDAKAEHEVVEWARRGVIRASDPLELLIGPDVPIDLVYITRHAHARAARDAERIRHAALVQKRALQLMRQPMAPVIPDQWDFLSSVGVRV